MLKYEYIGNKSGGILFELTGIRYTRTHCGNSRGQFGISTACVMFKFSWDFWKLWTLNAQKFPDANGFVMLCPKTQVDHQLAVQTDNDQSWLNAVILIPGKPLPYHAISMWLNVSITLGLLKTVWLSTLTFMLMSCFAVDTLLAIPFAPFYQAWSS